MSAPVLVTWATRSGSTEEVAQSIAATLREYGLVVDAQPVRTVHTLEGVSAVILGAPLYVARLHRDARRFLAIHREALRARPVALFVLGPIHNDEKEWPAARQQLQKELAKFPWLLPVAEEVFGGKWDPATLGLPFRWLPAMRNIPASDVRNWNAIRDWAGQLRLMLPSLCDVQMTAGAAL
ncbi:MAG TPA: flavodoxin domain-containing protein [Terracidiphilus sp.]|nr:flavodoxin domain-containing protein [Terracidiphilus sp.]